MKWYMYLFVQVSVSPMCLCRRLYWITSSTAGDRIVYASLDGSNITTVYTSVTKSGLSGLYYNVDTSR